MTKKKTSIRTLYSKASAKVRRQLKNLTGRPGTKQLVEKYTGEFPTLKALGPISDSDLRKLYNRAMGLLKTKTLTLTKHEKQIDQAIKTMQPKVPDLNRENFDYLMDFLDDARTRGIESLFGYWAILTALDRAVNKRGLSEEEIKANIEHWEQLAEQNKLHSLRFYKNLKPGSSSDDFKRKRTKR